MLQDSNLSILGDMVKSLSKRVVKHQTSIDAMQNEVASAKDHVDAAFRLISDVAARPS